MKKKEKEIEEQQQ